jgi:hypothetical protein
VYPSIGSIPNINKASSRDCARGDRYRIRSSTGEVFEGMVVVNDPPKDFAGTVQNLNNAQLAVSMYEVCGHEASIWLSTYGVPQTEVEVVRAGGKRCSIVCFAS